MIDVPYIVVVVEEASLMLNVPGQGSRARDRRGRREDRQPWPRRRRLRRARHAVPDNQSVPNHLREQFSRIGFKVQDWRASNIIINESGLEDLTLPGQGKMRCGGVFVPFRGFVLHPGDGPANLDDAGEEELEGVTRHRGRQPDRTLVLSHLPQASAAAAPSHRQGKLGANHAAPGAGWDLGRRGIAGQKVRVCSTPR